MKKIIAPLGIAAALAGSLALPASTTTAQAAGAPVKYANCKALNKAYPHGVKKYAATRDRYSSKGHTLTRASAATVSLALYTANIARDADKDGIACEK